jgi:3-deoxy-D-manno-octulosonic-acid transferase
VLKSVLDARSKKGKEDPARLSERMGIASCSRPSGTLVWIHAASVGESQSALILIETLLKLNPDVSILVTTGTVTSASLMEKRLPKQAIHQYYPLDAPKWVRQFIDHWKPNAALLMESEIWPNMIEALKESGTPCALINARLSENSFKKWTKSGRLIKRLLSSFSIIIAQTSKDEAHFKALGAHNVVVCDNIKYSAVPLPHDNKELSSLKSATSDRTIWLFASTHDGEEAMACRIHNNLKNDIKGLLTIIVPRHIERRDKIEKICHSQSLSCCLRGSTHNLPSNKDDIYIADTLGELGLFYRLAPIACIGRSFSLDGGGGHNPIEAAQLDCAVLHGPHVQYQAKIYEEMDGYGAAMRLNNEKKMEETLRKLMTDEETLNVLQNKASQFAENKGRALERVMNNLEPFLVKNDLIQDKKECA